MSYVTRYLSRIAANAANPLPKGLRAIFYDWDGTLIKSRLEGFLLCINDVRTEHNLAKMPSLGKSLRESLIPANKCHVEQEQMLGKFIKFFSKYPPTLMPGAEDLIKKMRGYGLIQGIVSNLPENILRREVENLGLSGYFSVIVGSRHDEHLKPKPALLEEAFSAAAVHPSQVIYIGDTKVDVLAAKAAHCTSVLVSKLEPEVKPDIPVTNLDRIREILEIHKQSKSI